MRLQATRANSRQTRTRILRHGLAAAISVVMSGLCFTAAFGQTDQQADLIITGANVATMDAARPHAQGIAIKDGRILAVGSDQTINRYAGASTEVLKLNGQFVMPGLIEGHAHFVGLGESQMMLKLNDAVTWEDIVKQVEAATQAVPAGQWLSLIHI